MAAKTQPQVMFRKDGVFVHTTIAKPDEDALVPGKIEITQKAEGIFVEWKQSVAVCDTSQAESEWTVVDNVSYKNHHGDVGSGSVYVNKKAQAKPPERHKYDFIFDVKDLKSFKRSDPHLGWSYLIFILRCGTTCPALHFHQGGTKAFIKELEKHSVVKRSPQDQCLYLVREHDPQALSKSFDELALFEEQSNDILSKFMKDPYQATMGGFSRVTKILGNVMISPDPGRPKPNMGQIPEILSEDLQVEISNQDEFEVITKHRQTVLPARPKVIRKQPVSPQQWSDHMDQEGKVINIDNLKEAIFRGGVDPSIRIEVWKFLLNYYEWDSTYKTRTDARTKKVDDYFRMKLQWKSISEDQEKRFGQIRERKNLIDKDVTRTDRTHAFFQGEDNPNIQVLYDILMTYCMHNFDLGYVQGMSDLLAPILVVMENEVDAFWCLAGFMELLGANFEMDQEGMKTQLSELHTLVKFVDPQLCNYLESHDSGNMYFCFRWLLIWFKREFNFPEIMRLWEVMWTDKPCKNFHLLICLAILDAEKTVLLENNFGFTEILKHINDMSGQIDLLDVLCKAESIYLQLRLCEPLPAPVADILGFPPSAADKSGSAQSSAASSRGSTPSTPERSSIRLPGTAVPASQLASSTQSTSKSKNIQNGVPATLVAPAADITRVERLATSTTNF